MCSSDAAQLHSWRYLQRRSTISSGPLCNSMQVAGMLRCFLLLFSITTCGLHCGYMLLGDHERTCSACRHSSLLVSSTQMPHLIFGDGLPNPSGACG